jgi:hypothetical protein
VRESRNGPVHNNQQKKKKTWHEASHARPRLVLLLSGFLSSQYLILIAGKKNFNAFRA